jgi:hypothetical protein
VPELLPALEELRALPNVQMFASMDPSTEELPPIGWRRAWIMRDAPNGPWPVERRLNITRRAIPDGTDETGMKKFRSGPPMVTAQLERFLVHDPALQGSSLEETPALICPEEVGTKKDCLSCGYCFEGKKHDVVFIEHHGPASAPVA